MIFLEPLYEGSNNFGRWIASGRGEIQLRSKNMRNCNIPCLDINLIRHYYFFRWQHQYSVNAYYESWTNSIGNTLALLYYRLSPDDINTSVFHHLHKSF